MKKLPKGLLVSSFKIVLSQDQDCCSNSEEEAQEIEVSFDDGGGGFYYSFKTERWSCDEGGEFLKWLDGICKELNSVSKD